MNPHQCSFAKQRGSKVENVDPKVPKQGEANVPLREYLYNSDYCMLIREKGRDLTQSCDKNPYTHRKIQKAT